jgi:hypothetical protein
LKRPLVTVSINHSHLEIYKCHIFGKFGNFWKNWKFLENLEIFGNFWKF